VVYRSIDMVVISWYDVVVDDVVVVNNDDVKAGGF
jgi:hypothetical protein